MKKKFETFDGYIECPNCYLEFETYEANLPTLYEEIEPEPPRRQLTARKRPVLEVLAEAAIRYLQGLKSPYYVTGEELNHWLKRRFKISHQQALGVCRALRRHAGGHVGYSKCSTPHLRAFWALGNQNRVPGPVKRR